MTNRILVISISILIVVPAIIVYWQVKDHGFITFDDQLYVYENPYVKNGFSLESVKWAFSIEASEGAYWHPFTWLSHMLDSQLFGLDPGMHHLVNLSFHIVNILLLFFLLNKLTGSLWKSAVVASFFGLHPINVDTVAWLAERKNLLSTSFWMLTILAYFYYLKSPNVFRYMVIVICFVLGLLSKPMLVTLPFVLLLLDYWPLSRITFDYSSHEGNGSISGSPIVSGSTQKIALRLVLEKIPLLILSFASIFISFVSYHTKESLDYAPTVPMLIRIENAVVSYLEYITKMLWPNKLTFYYPYPSMVPLWKLFVALIVLTAITTAALRLIRKSPYFIVGWLWYIGTLVPVLGIVQGGLWPEFAERWAYVPLIGLYIIIAWGIPDILRNSHYKKVALASSVFIVLLLLMFKTYEQVGYWKNSKTFYTYAIQVNNDNFIAHNNLGNIYLKEKNINGALIQFSEALRARPEYIPSRINMALALYNLGKRNEAIVQLKQAAMMKPDDSNIYYCLGGILLSNKQFNQAKKLYLKTLHLNPSNYQAHYYLAYILTITGNIDEAVFHYREALRINPFFAEAYFNLGIIESSRGSLTKADYYFSKAVQIDDTYAEAHFNLGIILIDIKKTDEAIVHLVKAVKLKPDNMAYRETLGNVLQSTGDLKGAIENLSAVVQKNPENARTQIILGKLLIDTGKMDEAIIHLKKALKIDPDSVQARDYLKTATALLEKN